jgi:RNA polymerase sigma factor for flagellar operon FliA
MMIRRPESGPAPAFTAQVINLDDFLLAPPRHHTCMSATLLQVDTRDERRVRPPVAPAYRRDLDDDCGLVDRSWEEYKRCGAREARDRLILQYSPLVKYVAGRVWAGLPQSAERADLISDGIFGLIEAIDRFDPDRNVKFQSYAIRRIRGAIIDGLRSVDWVPRSVRAKGRTVEKAYAKLGTLLLRTPTDAELAAELGISDVELQALFKKISFVGVVTLDEVLFSGSGDSPTLGESLPDRGEGPVAAFEVEEMKQILARAINRLGDREKMVLTLYYYEGLRLDDIAQILGVTESRVCQIHTKAILQLRSRIDR